MQQHIKGLRISRGQSRKSQVIAMGRSRMTRLFARARSYRVQIMGAPNARDIPVGRFGWGNRQKTLQWHDIQIIPRTHMRNDIDFEVGAALNAFNRREFELLKLFEQYGEDKVKNTVIVVSPHARRDAKGACELWRGIHVYLCQPATDSNILRGFHDYQLIMQKSAGGTTTFKDTLKQLKLMQQ